MKSNYKKIGDLIKKVSNNKNIKLLDLPLLGLNIEKEFMPSVANVIGTDMSKYQIVKKMQFACNPMHLGRDERIPTSLLMTDDEILVSPAYFVFEVIDKNTILPEYLMLYFKRNETDRFLWFKTDSSVRGGLAWDQMCEIEIPVPSIDKQRKIVAQYNQINKAIQIKEAINNNLEQQAQAIFKSWFVDFEPFGGKMPEDWKKGTLEDLSDRIICGKTPSTSREDYFGGNIPFITIPDMHNNTYVINSERYLSEIGANSQSNKLLPQNSICVSCIATAGLVSITAFESQTNQQINSIVPKQNISPYFVYSLLKTLSDTIIRLGSGGSTTCNLNKTQFSKIAITIPDESALREYHKKITPLFNKIKITQLKRQILLRLKDVLLPKLMLENSDSCSAKLSFSK